MAELYTELAAAGGSDAKLTVKQVRDAASTVAARHDTEILMLLGRSGRLRGNNTKSVMMLVAMAGSAVVLAVGILRLVIRSDLYGGSVPFPAYLAIKLFVFGIVGLVLLRIPDRSAAAADYLAWVDDATMS